VGGGGEHPESLKPRDPDSLAQRRGRNGWQHRGAWLGGGEMKRVENHCS